MANKILFGGSQRVYLRGADIGDDLETCGIDYAGYVTLSHRNGRYEVWSKTAGSSWGGVGLGRDYIPAWCVLVQTDRIESEKFYTGLEIEGKETAAKKYLAVMIAKCDELANNEN